MDRLKKDILEIIENKELLEQFKGRKILVTGATGLIGSVLIKTLHAANLKYSLTLTIFGQIRNIEKARKIYEDIIELDDIQFITSADIECDYIIHTVSPTASKFFIQNPVETIKASVGSTMEILEIARKNSAKVVYLSSMEQYGIPYTFGEKMTENKIGIIDHLNVRSSYSESKRLCECLCNAYASEYKVDVSIARLAQTMGAGVPSTDNRMAIQFARSVVKRENIVLHTVGKSVVNFVYLSDAIIAILLLLLKGNPGEAYNVCNDKETCSVYEVARLVADKIAKGSIDVLIEPIPNMGYAPDVNMYLVSDKIASLGWKAEVDMEEAYNRLVDYLGNHKN